MQVLKKVHAGPPPVVALARPKPTPSPPPTQPDPPPPRPNWAGIWPSQRPIPSPVGSGVVGRLGLLGRSALGAQASRRASQRSLGVDVGLSGDGHGGRQHLGERLRG